MSKRKADAFPVNKKEREENEEAADVRRTRLISVISQMIEKDISEEAEKTKYMCIEDVGPVYPEELFVKVLTGKKEPKHGADHDPHDVIDVGIPLDDYKLTTEEKGDVLRIMDKLRVDRIDITNGYCIVAWVERYLKDLEEKVHGEQVAAVHLPTGQ